MKVKTTLGWVVSHLERAIEVSRKEGKYAKQVSRNNGFWGKSGITPLNPEDYWSYMSTFHPWNQLVGIWNAAEVLPSDTEVSVSVAVIGSINKLLGKENV